MSGQHEAETLAPAWLAALQDAGRRRFEAHGLPTTRDEEWRNTSLDALREFVGRAPAKLELPRGAAAQELPWIPPGAPLLTFANGRFDASRSAMRELPRGVRLASLAELLVREPDVVREHLRPAIRPNGELADLNDARFEDGAVVLVDAGATIEQPLHVVFHAGLVAAANSPGVATHPRNLIFVGRGAKATIVESYVGAAAVPYFTNAVTELRLDDGAQASRLRIQLEGPAAYHVSSDVLRQGRDSELVAHSLDLGARLARHNLVAVLDGEGGRASLYGLSLTTGAQHVDNHTVLDHARPHCGSRELYKGILDGDSRSVFSGRIVVRPGAQKTDAKQSNRNLLLSKRALAHTRPQLEIYADDVKCTHGATIGQVDEEALFYLRTRGLERTAARNLLIEAFAREVLDAIVDAGLRETFSREIAARLPGAGSR